MLAEVYLDHPRVRANLVQGVNGTFADQSGSSRGISNETDRTRLLELRGLCDVLVTDGETARLENYRIPLACDLAVITRVGFVPRQGESSKKYLELKSDPVSAVQSLIHGGYKRILLETGPRLLNLIQEAGLLDQICLTNTGGSTPDLSAIAVHDVNLIYTEVIRETTFTVWDQIRL